MSTTNSNLFSPNCEKCGQIPTYADDSTVVISTTSRFEAQEKIISITDKMKIFLSSNSLSLNLSKTEIVEIMVRQKTCQAGRFSTSTICNQTRRNSQGNHCQGLLSVIRRKFEQRRHMVPPIGPRRQINHENAENHTRISLPHCVTFASQQQTAAGKRSVLK